MTGHEPAVREEPDNEPEQDPKVFVVKAAPEGAICSLCGAAAAVLVDSEAKETPTPYCVRNWEPIALALRRRGHTIQDNRQTAGT